MYWFMLALVGHAWNKTSLLQAPSQLSGGGVRAGTNVSKQSSLDFGACYRTSVLPPADGLLVVHHKPNQASSLSQKSGGYGSKFIHQGSAGFSLWFHLPRFHFGHLFLTHSQVVQRMLLAKLRLLTLSQAPPTRALAKPPRDLLPQPFDCTNPDYSVNPDFATRPISSSQAAELSSIKQAPLPNQLPLAKKNTSRPCQTELDGRIPFLSCPRGTKCPSQAPQTK